jgi:hypothetical protein
MIRFTVVDPGLAELRRHVAEFTAATRAGERADASRAAIAAILRRRPDLTPHAPHRIVIALG